MIDGAFVFTGHQLLLGFKYSSPDQPDVFEIARSTTGQPQGPWQLVGRPDIEVDGGTIENYEFVMAAGHWRLVATSNNLDQPWLFTLAGDPATAAGWLQWTGGYQLDVPSEAFNSGPGISEHRTTSTPIRPSCAIGHLAARPLLLPALRRAATSSPSSAAGVMPRSVWPAAPIWSTGRYRPAEPPRRVIGRSGRRHRHGRPDGWAG